MNTGPVISAMYVFLAGGVFAQEPNGEGPAEQVTFMNRQIRLVDSYRNSGDYRAAESVLREWLPMEPTDREPRLMIQISLADLLREEGRLTEARQLFAQTMDSPSLTWQLRLSGLIGMADIDLGQGDLKSSIDGWNKALVIARERGDTGSEAIISRGLGRAWLGAGSTARAEPLLRRSLRMVESDGTSPPPQIAASLGAMAEYYLAGNKLAMAEEAWSRALTIQRAAFGENHPQVAYTMEMLAQVHAERGEWGPACEYAERAAEVMRQWFGEESPAAATAVANLALVEEHAHALGDAATHYETAVRFLRHFPDLWPTMKVVMQHYAGVLKALHRNSEAKALDVEVKAFHPHLK